eukprot:scaffold14777_cov110-Skeletonema_dohrnii-CCMP3373.AAC.1
MAIPSMIAPPKPSPRRRSDIPQQRPVPKPSPLPKHPGRRARSFMSPRDRRMLASGKYKRNQRQQNNTVVDSPRNNFQQRPQRMSHMPIDAMASTTSSHDESQPRIASPQHVPHVNIGTPIKTPQYTASIDFNDEQLHYKSVEETSLEGVGDYQSEMFPPLSPDKSLFSHATEASGSPPKTLFSYWLSPPSNKHRKYSSSDEDDSTFDGLSTMYSSMVPSDFGSPARQAQTINADDVEFHPPRPFDDLMSPPDKKWSNSVDLVSRCPESPITPQDQHLYGHLHNNYPERSFTPSRKIEYDNEFPLTHGSSIVQDEIEVDPEFESSVSYPPQDPQPTNPVGEKKRPVAIKKTKLKSASSQQHQRRKWDFNNLDAISSDSVDDSSRMESNGQSSPIESSSKPEKRRWKFEELLESNDDSDMSPSAELNDSSLPMSSVTSDQKESLNKQDNVSSDDTPGKRKWKFEELLASPDDGRSSRASSVDELVDNLVPSSESDDSVRVEDSNNQEHVDNLITPGKRKWKFEELLASIDDADNNGTSRDCAQQESIVTHNKTNIWDNNNGSTTPGKRKWRFEELLASNEDGESSPFVRMDNESAQSDSDDSILNIVLEKQNNQNSPVITSVKRRWKFEDLLASNDDDDESSSARLSSVSIESRSTHLYEEIEYVQSQSAVIDETELHDIITIFQSRVRGAIVRQSYRQCHDAAVIIQKFVRTHNLNRVRQWEAAIVEGLKDFPATEADRIKKHLLTCNGKAHFNLQQSQNYLDYHSSIIGMLSTRISDIQTLRRYEQYHRFLSSVVQMQANIRARQSRKPLTRMENKCSQEMEGTGKEKHKSNDSISDQIQRYSQAHAAMVLLQALFRGALCRRRMHAMHLATIQLQHYTRAMLQRRRYRRFLSGLIAFQATVRGVLERKSSVILKSVVSVQSHIRAFTMRSRYLKARTCIILIQKEFRGMQAMTRVKRLHCCASSIQSIAQGFVVRRRYAKIRRGVISFQALVRGQHARNIAAVTVSALMNIQCHIRTLIQMKKYNRLRMAAILVQSKMRAFKQKSQFQTTAAATLCIQSFVRGSLVRKQLSFASSNAVIIQQKWVLYREIANMQNVKISYANDLTEVYMAATKIQSAFRMHQCWHEVLRKKEEYRIVLAQKEAIAATQIQSAVRMWMCRQLISRMAEERDISRRCDAAVVIQSFARSIHCQRELATLKEAAAQIDDERRSAAAVVLQSFGRSVICQRMAEDMKRQNREHNAVRMAAATTIQSKVRSRQCEKELSRRRLQACEMRNAATKLQSYWRSWACRTELAVASRHATTIQRCYN